MPAKKSAAEECCAKCEKDVAALRKEVAALKKQLAKISASGADPRVDTIIEVIKATSGNPKLIKKLGL